MRRRLLTIPRVTVFCSPMGDPIATISCPTLTSPDDPSANTGCPAFAFDTCRTARSRSVLREVTIAGV